MPRLYGLYDTGEQKLWKSPVKLAVSYTGDGELTADSRGFVYAGAPLDPSVLPGGEAYRIKVNGQVYGSGFSRDRATLFLIVGREGETRNLDLIVTMLKTGKQVRLPGAFAAELPQSMVSDAKLPVDFYDDGKQVTFAGMSSDGITEIRFAYSWETGKVGPWSPPIGEAWSGYKASDDGLYRMFANGGLYRGGEKVAGGEELGFGESG
ncbi:hypothetical protein N6H14_07555 [Paenibacillus sp. CC-CFT747]|nr:hypothetical protein N6H14_07555 [Paenibacillus sp. CC-CFT747]